MEVEITDGVLFMVTFALIGWAWRTQKNISDIETELAINTTRDQAINIHMTNMENMIKEISATVNKIEKQLAFEQGRNEKHNKSNN